ncbi:MAG: JAB domain-containing protein, partial [Novosphingobium sp.]
FAGRFAETIADRLLARFGSLDRLLTASDQQIVAACEERADIGSMIAGARTLVLAAFEESITRAAVDPNDQKLARYLTLKFRGRPYEELHAIFVDYNHGFLAEELVSIGDAGRVEARVSAIMRRAMELGASGFYLLHNHPSKAPNPSVEDVRATRQVAGIAHALDITLLDHWIIAGTNVISMRRLGLL